MTPRPTACASRPPTSWPRSAAAPMTVWTVARQPRWIGALIVTLAVAAAFVLLSQWQIERSIEQATVIDRDTEQIVQLETVASPQQAVTSASAGQLVRVEADIVPGDAIVISGRLNYGTEGYWVTGHVVTSAGVSLAIAAGWTESEDDAARAAGILSRGEGAPSTLVGRYLPSEGSYDDDFEDGERSAMAVATLVNEWAEAPNTVYGGYLILSEPLAGLEAIDSPTPSTEIDLNWLNIFYAIEWVVFAGFALYLWYRLVRDAWEREQLEREEAELN